MSRELQYLEQGFNWGFKIPPQAKRYQWFKLDLESSPANVQFNHAIDFPDPKAVSPDNERTTEVLIIDYLQALRTHFEAVFKKNLPKSVSSTTPIEYIITVPAMWSDSAKAKTRECAEQAGMGRSETLRLVSEPEAAAIYSMRQMRSYGLTKGDTVVICDAGGGTVDLITYRIDACTPTLRVTEVVAGRGGKCGSCFLNRRFGAFIRRKLSGHDSWKEEMLDDVCPPLN